MIPTPHYLYVFEMVGYARKGNPKVGITGNVTRRAKQLTNSYGDRHPFLLAFFEFPDIVSARRAENAVINAFTPRFPPAREIFKESCEEVVGFIRSAGFHCKEVWKA